jgi:sugar (pentulose or hexulose) kinase
MPELATYIVVDIGKTLSKVTAWSRGGQLVDRHVRPNEIVEVGGVRRLDVGGIEEWLSNTLAKFAGQPVEAIIPVAHGAGVAALSPSGGHLLFAPFDYEQRVPNEIMAAYRELRDPFAITGSPALPHGLNMGTQLFWMEHLYPSEMANATLVPWAQYWAWFLCGKAAAEVTSLGCHSDIWLPLNGGYSPLAQKMGWDARFAPLANAADQVGILRPALATETGLPAGTKICAGIHDSNAALLAARGFKTIADNEATILSTGTWFVAMRLPREPFCITSLPEARDTLVNVDAYGAPVPSARFMGGREIESVIEIDTRRVDIKPDQPLLLQSVQQLLARCTMMMPTLAPGFGPFPDQISDWRNAPEKWSGTWYARRAAMCLYAALVADTSLDLIGSSNILLIEGRFAEAEVFVGALAALRPEMRVYIANAHNDVSFGALRLVDPSLEPNGELCQVAPLEGDLLGYKAIWHQSLAAVPA